MLLLDPVTTAAWGGATGFATRVDSCRSCSDQSGPGYEVPACAGRNRGARSLAVVDHVTHRVGVDDDERLLPEE